MKKLLITFSILLSINYGYSQCLTVNRFGGDGLNVNSCHGIDVPDDCPLALKAMTKKFGGPIAKKLVKGTICVGMTEEMVLYGVGYLRPDEVRSKVTKNGKVIIWQWEGNSGVTMVGGGSLNNNFSITFKNHKVIEVNSD